MSKAPIGRATGWNATFALLIAFGSTSTLASIRFDEPTQIFRDGGEPQIAITGLARTTVALPDAQVTVTSSDGRRAEGVADATGRFSLRADIIDPTAILSIRARGIGAQSHLEVASLPGDFAFLLERGGGIGASISEIEVPALDVNLHQTALYAGMVAVPPTVLAPTGRPFELLAGGFSLFDVFLQRGRLLPLLASGQIALPAGAETILDAISDPSRAIQAYDAAQALGSGGCPSHPVCAAQALISSSADQVRLLDPPPFGVKLLSYITFTGGTSGLSLELELAADGSGNVAYAENARIAAVWAATATPGVVRVARADGNPLSSSTSYPTHPSCACQVEQTTVEIALRVVFAEGPRGVVLLGFSSERERRYPNNPAIPTVIDPVLEPTFLASTVGSGETRGAFGLLAGTSYVLPRCGMPDCSFLDTPGSASTLSLVREPHRFDPGGSGATLRLGETFDWSVDAEGRLDVDYHSGASARFEIGSLDRTGGIAGSTFTASTGATYVTSSDFMEYEPDARFTVAELTSRTYTSTIGCDMPFAVLSPNCRPGNEFTYRFNADGTGTAGSGTLTWTLDAQGRLEFRRFSGSTLFQVRNWQKVAGDASGVHVLENFGALNPPPDTSGSYAPTARLLRYSY